MFLLCSLDCKTVCIFAYSSTREQSNKRSGTTLKTESKRPLCHALPISLLILRKKTDCFTVYMFFKVFRSLYIHVCFYHPKRGLPTARKAGVQVLDSGFSTVDSGFQVLGSWLFVVFQLLAGFRIPWAGISDSKATILDPTNKNFAYSRSHKQKFPVFQIPQAKTSRITDPTNKNLPYYGSHKQKFSVFQIPQTKTSRIADPTNKNFLYCRSHKQKFPVFQIPQAKTSRIPDPTNKNLPYFRSHKQKFPVFQIPLSKFSLISDPTNKTPVFPIPKAKISRIVESGVPCMLRERECTAVIWFISILFFIYSCLW